MDVKAFDESILAQDHCCMIKEGTVANLYVKHYTYDIFSDKFEENGILHGMTDTIVYEVEVNKTWYGEEISKDTIFIEDTSYFTEPILAVKEGGRYVLPLYEYGASIWTLGHEYADGEIFTFRLTDVDDLITNTVGAFLGYYLYSRFSENMFSIQPLISDVMWGYVLSSKIWESIR